MKKKILVSAKTLNKLVKGMGKFQNQKNKLNAGEKREAATGVLNACVNDLSKAEKLELIHVLIHSI